VGRIDERTADRIFQLPACGRIDGVRGGNSLYASTDDGGRWSIVGPGIGGPESGVMSYALSPTHMYAGSSGRGVWVRPLRNW